MKIKILIILLLVLTSCQYIPGVDEKIETVDIHKGTEGLKITLINPNPKIIENQNIFLILQLENKGAADITNGLYNIITDKYIQIKENNGTYSIKGKTLYNPKGELNQIQIEGQSAKLPKQTEHYKSQIAVQTCYKYNTKASLNICIDTDIISKRPKPCIVRAENFRGGQGGPISITKIEPIMMPKGDSTIPAFQIYIKNSGKGFIINKSDVKKACKREKGNITYNAIYAKVRIGDKELDCGKTTKKMIKNEAKIFCKVKDEDAFTKQEGTFNTILEIDLEYGYEKTQSTKIDITKIA